ncbi:hypothetical protein HZ326_8657 [Fusarium oxysporum f. sp. albedinis]|nr:hypothetical protein HZ326_8657 [Fusarium oxysporum f. sp. albedinis]
MRSAETKRDKSNIFNYLLMKLKSPSTFPDRKNYHQKRHTTAGIRWSSPTQLLIRPLSAYLWESGRDPEFSDRYGRM